MRASDFVLLNLFVILRQFWRKSEKKIKRYSRNGERGQNKQSTQRLQPGSGRDQVGHVQEMGYSSEGFHIKEGANIMGTDYSPSHLEELSPSSCKGTKKRGVHESFLYWVCSTGGEEAV